MLKKVTLAAGVFGISLFTIATMTFAQTTTPSPTTANTTITPSPTTTVPGGAPATGRAN